MDTVISRWPFSSLLDTVLLCNRRNNNMTSMILSSLCQDRTKRHRRDYCCMRGVSVVLYVRKRLAWWYLMSESCKQAVGTGDGYPQSALFSLGSPSPKAHARQPAETQSGHSSHQPQPTHSPQLPSPTWSLNLHHNENRGGGARKEELGKKEALGRVMISQTGPKKMLHLHAVARN